VNRTDYAELVALALNEDLGGAGDITSQAVIPDDSTSSAQLVARAQGVLAGLEVAAYVFEVLDPTVRFEARAEDGDSVHRGDVIAAIVGNSRTLLAAERTALNFLSRMSGVATATRRLVEAIDGTGAMITDTRKTMPGMRALDKHAVLMGGGVNHRMGLYDAVMIKDNHIAAAGDIVVAVEEARRAVGAGMRVIVEVEDLDQLVLVLGTDADRVLLDNMTVEMLRRAVEMVGGRMETEASGGVSIDNVRAIAETRVDVISVGWITHSAPQLDIALDFSS
jgi:nicotinate-nucleotide pyrophosphorylase (carboxylating)